MSEKKIDKILVGVDDSADALLAFDYAIKRAKEEEAELIIASVLESDELSVYQAMDKDYIHANAVTLRSIFLTTVKRPLMLVLPVYGPLLEKAMLVKL
ncbi:universal stress protein family [Liquorilactobacillus sucicola DSM 21376 = JCM 15457]|nr:universal stress protein family [Liquorilactobacillus sucicola DSM 21376 = JCM 15457]